MKENPDIGSGLLDLIGVRYWSASVLPALVGTTLPFWLDPPGFEFKLAQAAAFLTATAFAHSGFSLLHAGFANGPGQAWKRERVFSIGILALAVSVLIVMCLNAGLELDKNVPGYIFPAYGLSVVFTGLLYVCPPFSFYRRTFGEVIICIGLGMLPVLGAYLVQVGDLTRTVYLASLPVVASTGLWVWIIELIERPGAERSGYTTLVTYFTPGFSGRYVTLLLVLSVYAALVLAVLGRSSLNPFSLAGLASVVFAVRMMRGIWKGYQDPSKLQTAAQCSISIHATISTAIIAASLSSAF